MSGNTTSKAKPKMADVTKPKKATDGSGDQLVIQSRPIIGKAMSAGTSVSDEQNPDGAAAPSAPTLPSQSKRTMIVPISDDGDKEVAPTNTAEAAPDAPKAAAADATPPKKAENAQEPAPKKAAPEPAAEDKDEPDADGTGTATSDDKAEGKDEKPNPETEKALAEAAAAEKRQHELESLIDSKQFYVPINAVAQKKSIKVSWVMTVLVFLLAVVLIDLMLDSGTILLVQKIPHTHFFSSNN